MPFEQEDLKWLQDATKEELALFINSFKLAGNSKMILSGCVASASGPDVAITAGLLIIDNELVTYGGGTITIGAGANTYDFEVDTDYDSAGLETYENGTPHNTYQTSFASIGAVAGAQTQQQVIDYFNGIQRLHHYFHATAQETWKYPTLHASVTNNPASGYGGSHAVRYRKGMDKKISLGGTFTQPASSTPIYPSPIYTLPVGYRPANKVVLSMAVPNPTDAIYPRQVIIETNGDVKVDQSTTATSHSFDGLSFPLD